MHPAIVALATRVVLPLALAAATSAAAQTPAKKPAGKTAAATKAGVAAGAGAMASPAAAAAPAAPKEPEPAPYVWEKEPSSFLGVKLIEPISVPPCPTKRYGKTAYTEVLDVDATSKMPGVCFDPTFMSSNVFPLQTPYVYKLENLPGIGVSYTVLAYTKLDVITKFTVTFKARDFQSMLDVFKSRYGEPTEVIRGTAMNAMGAEFSNNMVIWRGKSVTIVMSERTDKIDQAIVSIYDNKTEAAEDEERKKLRAREAQKL